MTSDSSEFARLQEVLENWLVAIEKGEQPDLMALCGGDADLAARASRALDGEGEALRSLTQRDTISQASLPRERIGSFRLLRLLGRGGMATVFLAEDLSLPRFVALKVFDASTFADPRARARFRREAEITAALEHPNIVPVYAVGEDDGMLFLAMKFLSGPALDRLGKPQSPQETARLGIDIASALHCAHELGILHRDVKPANILLDNGRPMVLDFGLARAKHDVALTQTGAVPGTLAYMAPELMKAGTAAMSPAVDIYALGATLFEICAGRPCFESDDPETVVRQILTDDPPLLKLTVDDRDLATIVDKCLRKEPESRYRTMLDLIADLSSFIERRPIEARPRTLRERFARSVRRNRKASIALGSALSIVLALAAKVATQNFERRSAETAAVSECERAIHAFDVPNAMAALRNLRNLGFEVDRSTLASACVGLESLDELLDRLQRSRDGEDLERLGSLMSSVANSGIEAFHYELTHLALAVSNYQVGDLAQANQHLDEIESKLGSSRAIVALRGLLVRDVPNLDPYPARGAIDHVIAAIALRRVGSSNEQIRKELDAAWAIDPTDYRVKLANAIQLEVEEQYEAALSAYRSLERKGRSNAQLIRNAAINLTRLDDVEGALKELDRIPDGERTASDARIRLTALYQAGRIETFDSLLADSLGRWPDSVELLLVRLMREQSRGDLLAVIATCDAITAKATHYSHRNRAAAERIRARARLLERNKERTPEQVADLKAEIEALLPSMRSGHAKSILYTAIGRLALLSSDLSLAVESFRAAVSSEPDDPVALFALAQFLYERESRLVRAKETSLELAGKRVTIPELRAETRALTRSILSLRKRSKFTYTPELMVNTAIIAATLARSDGDKKSCVEAIENGFDTASKLSLDSKLLDQLRIHETWARSP